MIKVIQSGTFAQWLESLRDRQVRQRISARILRMSAGNMGDAKSVGGGVGEMRIDYGPGYRVYFTRRGLDLVVLLCGGDKRTQQSDIQRAIALAGEWKSR